jgi:hypothetical protein
MGHAPIIFIVNTYLKASEADTAGFALLRSVKTELRRAKQNPPSFRKSGTTAGKAKRGCLISTEAAFLFKIDFDCYFKMDSLY